MGAKPNVVTATLPIETHKEVEARALALHTSVSSVIRHAVIEHFAAEKKRGVNNARG